MLAAGAVACTNGRSSTGSDPQVDDRPQTDLPPDPQLRTDPFALGVASGDPLPDGVVVWTRLLVPPEVGPVPVRWTMSNSSGEVVAGDTFVTDPALGHSVHVDVVDLEPSSTYTYQFGAGGFESPIGRTRTAPRTSDVIEGLRFAVMSCQGYQTGFYAAYRHLVDEGVDVGFFVGDYIYELESSLEARPHGLTPPRTLDEFRTFYELYKRDADLQAAHAAFPWIVTWDDHEVEDNYASLEPGAVGRALDPQADTKFATKRAAAYQAWWEHMPVRLPPPRDGSLKIYRSFGWGDLATFAVLDNRQYRSPIPTGAGAGNLPRAAGGGPQLAAAFDESATYLGAEQETWVEGVLEQSSAVWNVLVQQTVMAEFDRAPDDPERGFSMDSWDGYVAPRQRLLGFVERVGVDNLVSVGGDIHSSAVTDLKVDYRDPSASVVGTEFVGPSITSLERLPDGYVEGGRSNGHVHYYDIERHGYLVGDMSPDALQIDYRYTSALTDPNATIETGSSWTVASGAPGAQPT